MKKEFFWISVEISWLTFLNIHPSYFPIRNSCFDFNVFRFQIRSILQGFDGVGRLVFALHSDSPTLNQPERKQINDVIQWWKLDSAFSCSPGRLFQQNEEKRWFMLE